MVEKRMARITIYVKSEDKDVYDERQQGVRNRVLANVIGAVCELLRKPEHEAANVEYALLTNNFRITLTLPESVGTEHGDN